MGLEDIKKLREITLVGINECKQALADAKGNFDAALRVLRERGAQVMEKRSARATRQGIVDSYIHFGGNLGTLVEVNCETDFVARTDAFKKFVRDVSMHIAAVSPLYVKREDIPESIAAGVANMDEYAKEHCLLEQAYVKDDSMSIGDYLRNTIAQTGENIVIKRFARFCLGE
ncbi:MAG: elongation factor Ts [Candidatus Omnitrophota bacterium]